MPKINRHRLSENRITVWNCQIIAKVEYSVLIALALKVLLTFVHVSFSYEANIIFVGIWYRQIFIGVCDNCSHSDFMGVIVCFSAEFEIAVLGNLYPFDLDLNKISNLYS